MADINYNCLYGKIYETFILFRDILYATDIRSSIANNSNI